MLKNFYEANFLSSVPRREIGEGLFAMTCHDSSRASSLDHSIQGANYAPGVTAYEFHRPSYVSGSVVTPRLLSYDPGQFCSGSPSLNFVCEQCGEILRRSCSWLVAELPQAS